MILQLINYPLEGCVEQESSKSPQRRGIVLKKPRTPIKLLIQTNNFMSHLKSPKLQSCQTNSRKNELQLSQMEFNERPYHREQNNTFYSSNNTKNFFRLGSEQKNRFATIKKVFKTHDEKGCLFLERKLSLLKFNFKEKEEKSQRVDNPPSFNISRIPQTAQSSRKQCSSSKSLQFQNKIHRRFNSDTDQPEVKPNRKQIVSYQIRPNTQYNDRDHQQFAQSIFEQYIKSAKDE